MIPKVMFTNYKKEFKGLSLNHPLFEFKRYWSGKLIKISIKHYEITLDFRGSMIDDMMNFTAKK